MTAILSNGSDPVSDWGRLRVAIVLTLVSLFVGAPFLTNRGLGTGEAYNYSLSVADFVSQTRSGILPVLVGQTEYAFNGRIHPVRTAPFFLYAAATLDTLTFHQLNFWALQNFTVALSLMLGAGSMFACLRWATQLKRSHAAILGSFYVLSPGVLAPAYAMDLYMTVMVVPWVPIALGAVARSYQDRSRSTYLLLAISLSACWAAHPPVALWLSFAVVLGELPLILAGKIRIKESLAIVTALLLGMLLTLFVFVSAFSVQSYGVISHAENVTVLLKEVHRSFRDSLLPVSGGSDQLGNFQLGYAGFAALVVALASGLIQQRRRSLIFSGIAVLFYSLLVPLPGINAWIWSSFPAIIPKLTNQWPMQRLYLPITALLIFAIGLGMPFSSAQKRSLIRLTYVILGALGIWTIFQAGTFVFRGFRSRETRKISAQKHLPENIDPTVTSFAFLGAPPWFVNGVMDPRMEGRLLAPFDAHLIASNWTQPALIGKTLSGSFHGTAEGLHEISLAPPLLLEANTKYLLTFDFMSPPGKMQMQLRGNRLHRDYWLPEAGNPEGFGMLPHNRHALSLWHTGSGPERFQLRLLAIEGDARQYLQFADYSLTPLDTSKLPIEITGLAPLTATIRSPSAAYFEAPRSFIPGYRATVNGVDVHVQSSPNGLLLVPVPAGESRVTIEYRGLRFLRFSFWVWLCSWISVGLASFFFAATSCFGWSRPRDRLRAMDVGARRAAHVIATMGWKLKWYLILGFGVLALAAIVWTQKKKISENVGPIHLKVIFDRHQIGRIQPLLVSGIPYEGDFIFVRLLDDRHIAIGTDVWGKFGSVSEPIELDYFAEHDLVISNGALYPDGHTALARLRPEEVEKLRNTIRVELNGRVVFEANARSFPTKLSQLSIGKNRIGGSNAGEEFTGEILQINRLPVDHGLGR